MTCTRCGREIVEGITSPGIYFHVPAHGPLLIRGCRAASFNPEREQAWDDLPKSWVATAA